MSKIKIKKILSTNTININGKDLPKYQILTEDDEVMETFSNLEVGQEYEGEVTEDPKYGKKFKRTGGGGFKGFGGFGAKSDPDTMLMAYAKDIVVSLIKTDKIKKADEASKILRSFTALMFGIYDNRKTGKQIIAKKEEPKKETEEEVEEKTPKSVKEDKVDIDDLPF